MIRSSQPWKDREIFIPGRRNTYVRDSKVDEVTHLRNRRVNGLSRKEEEDMLVRWAGPGLSK